MIEYNSGVCEGQEKTPAINGVNIYGGVDYSIHRTFQMVFRLGP